MSRTLFASLVFAAACSSPSHTTTDAPAHDGAGGDGTCGGEDYFTGAIVDWDSGTAFCGVFQATLTVTATPTNTDSTAPNGRFQLCLPAAAATRVDIAPPTAQSQCNLTDGLYQIPGITVASHDVIASGATIEYRMIAMDRVTPFFSGLGVMYDNTKATVFVHVAGASTSKPVISSAAQTGASALEYDGSAWGSGSAGQDVVFANTDPSGGTTTVSFSDGTGLGSGTFPVAAGTFTYVTLVGN